jgi:hypothetical protein
VRLIVYYESIKREPKIKSIYEWLISGKDLDMSEKEATIYTHYGTIPVSERRDHKAAQGRVCIFLPQLCTMLMLPWPGVYFLPPALYHANAACDFFLKCRQEHATTSSCGMRPA